MPSRPRVEADFQNLMVRMRQRTYPETVPALAYLWLRTLYVSGYDRPEWNQLDQLLVEALNGSAGRAAYPGILAEIRSRLREDGLLTGEAPPPAAPVLTERTGPPPEVLVPYFVRLLNEWLPNEVARLMIDQTDVEGVPALAVARALERLLTRQRLSRLSLQTALDASLFSPKFVYPAHYEILRDAALFLLGRTALPPHTTRGVALLSTAADARLFDDYAEAVTSAKVIGTGGTDQLEVPITPAQSKALLGGDEFRVGSIVVTMDGRWWRAHTLRGGEQNAISYHPAGRLRIDFAGECASVRVPWLDRRASWSGPTLFPKLELFGREWQTVRWDQDSEGAWLVLVSTGPLAVAKLAAGADRALHQCRPAFVDIAWAALENALSLTSADARSAAVEQLRREEIIPVGRSLGALANTLAARSRTPAAIEGRLVAVAFHASALELVYGKVPWRILPLRMRSRLLRSAVSPEIAERLRTVFDEVPDTPRTPRLWSWLQHSFKGA